MQRSFNPERFEFATLSRKFKQPFSIQPACVYNLSIMDEDSKAAQVGFSFLDAEATPWRASTFAAGVEVKDLGSADGRAMQLVRFPPGTVFPLHKHVGPEFVYILEGEMIQNGVHLKRGWASVASAGTVDRDVRSEAGCTFLIIYSE